VDGLWRMCSCAHDEGRYDASWLLPLGSVQWSIGFQRRPLSVECERRDQHGWKCAPRHIISRTQSCRAFTGSWVVVCNVRGWQCAEDDRGVRDSGVWCDVGGGVDGFLRVSPRTHGEGRYDMSWLLPFGSVPIRIGFQRRRLGVGCERRDQHAKQCAPRRINRGTHIELSLAFGWWFAKCGVGNVPRTIGSV
jgi:hypothetical protein